MRWTAPLVTTLVVSCVALLLAIGAMPASAVPGHPSRGGEVIEGQYIVVYEDEVRKVAANTNRRERRLGFRTDRRYGNALRGFAARLSPGQARRLRRDPKVDFVAPDRRVEAAAEVPLEPGDEAPTGVRRILAATEDTAREQSGVGVAVLDTGIDLSHPDLDAQDGVNCISPGTPANDGHGHGTHVAGTIAAKNDGSGVVGVAPETEVHAVKVLDDDGSGSTSSVVCGIDWVTENHDSLGIEVANMSLGGPGPPVKPCDSTTDPEHLAICESTEAGVNYVVAAGNDGWDFDFESQPDVPAAYPEVLTVTALSDSDGEPGGVGGDPTCRPGESDETAASFSNFASTAEGEAHTIAAPGVCIESTLSGGGYGTFSGTSMASPHMAGVVALCIDEVGADGQCAGKTPAEVITQMREDAEAFNGDNPGYGFEGDPSDPLPEGYYGFLTVADRDEDRAPPETTITSGPGDGSLINTNEPTFGFSSTEASSTFECKVDGGDFSACTSPSTIGPLSEGQHTFSVRARDAVGNADPTPASRTFTVDATPPGTTITSGPSGTASSTSASFGFTAGESGSTFQCRLDGGSWSACSSPRSYSNLDQGPHTFSVRATDQAGNVGAAASRSFTVDTVAPRTRIVKGLRGKTKKRKAVFRFRASERSSFQCRLTGKRVKRKLRRWRRCGPVASTFRAKRRYRKLRPGKQVFRVRATDRVGNAGRPAKRVWRVRRR